MKKIITAATSENDQMLDRIQDEFNDIMSDMRTLAKRAESSKSIEDNFNDLVIKLNRNLSSVSSNVARVMAK